MQWTWSDKLLLKAGFNKRKLSLVWWKGVDYKHFCATLCTRSDLLVIYSLGYLYFLNLHHSAYKSMGFGRCAHPRKKVVLTAFLVVINQTKCKEDIDNDLTIL